MAKKTTKTEIESAVIELHGVEEITQMDAPATIAETGEALERITPLDGGVTLDAPVDEVMDALKEYAEPKAPDVQAIGLLPVSVIRDLRFTDETGHIYQLDSGRMQGEYELRIVG